MTQHPFLAHDFASTEVGLIAACLEDATREWREEIGDVGQDAIVWQPFEHSHSIGGLILHMADAEAWWIEEIVAGKERPAGEEELLLSEETQQYGVQWPVPPREPLSWYYDVADNIRARTLLTLSTVEDLDRYEHREGWQRAYNVRWILAHVAGHESYHGGQAVLLKLLHERIKV